MSYLAALIVYCLALAFGGDSVRFWHLLAAAGFWALLAIADEIRHLRKSQEKGPDDATRR